MDKVDLPDWAGDDYVERKADDAEAMLVKTIKKINEIVEWINAQ